jgi:hypothetical protein
MGEVVRFPDHVAIGGTASRELGTSAVETSAFVATKRVLDALERLQSCLGSHGVFASVGIESLIEDEKLAIWHQQKFRGVWVFRNEAYCWIPAAYLLPEIRTATTEEAAWSTIAKLVPRST